jgi:hypothetical protein
MMNGMRVGYDAHNASTPRRPMDICHEHNFSEIRNVRRPFGIRVSLAPGDSFVRLLGHDWEQTHWYGAAAERDRALADMAREHLYSRRGDRPSLRFEPINQAQV